MVKRTLRFYSTRWVAAGMVGCVSSATACGDDGAPPAIAVDTTMSSTGAWTESVALTDLGPAEAVGLDAEGRVRAVVDGQSYVVTGGQLELRPRFADDGAPSQFGAISRIRPRVAGGAWLAAATGLWSATELFVRHRPTDLPSPDLVDVAEVASGALAGLWLAAGDGTYWASATEVVRIEADRPAERLAATPDAVALVDAGAVRILTAASDGLYIQDAPFSHAVVDVEANGGDLYAATDGGLFRYRAGEWREVSLAAAPVAITSLAVSGHDLWVRTSTGVIRVSGDTATEFPSLGRGPLAVDALGDVYAPTVDGLARASTGIVGADVPTFRQDVRPWIDDRCAVCHSNQTQDFRDDEVFRAIADDALTRVRSGDMPRCAGGVRCPPESALSPDDYAVLERWIRAGRPE